MKLLLALAAIAASSSFAGADDPAKVFEERIVPIFKSPKPSSCVQCHFAAVDLKDYIRFSARDTFLALRDQGLIDLEKPSRSKILGFIERGANEPGAKLIPENLRKTEAEAFRAWIEACAADPALRAAPKSDLTAKVKPVEVVRHARRDRMGESFEAGVWALRFRCMNCHTEGTPQNDKLRKEHGDGVAWFKKDGPAATLDHLLGSRLIDFANPEDSLLLTKPLGTVKHGGGVKFTPGDQGYKAMRAWLEDVAAIRREKYVKAADLPAKTDVKAFGSEIWFKLVNTPEAWGDKLLQVTIHAWDEKTNAWEKAAVATSDRMVFGKGRLWQHTLTLVAPAGSAQAKEWAKKATLPPGRYLVKVHVDGNERLKKDWTATLGDAEFAGQIEVRTKWTEGYGAMTVADGGAVK